MLNYFNKYEEKLDAFIGMLIDEKDGLISKEISYKERYPEDRLTYAAQQIVILVKGSSSGLKIENLNNLLAMNEFYFFMPVLSIRLREINGLDRSVLPYLEKIANEKSDDISIFTRNVYLLMTYVSSLSVKPVEFFEKYLVSRPEDLICINKVILHYRNAKDLESLKKVHTLCLKRIEINLTEREQVYFSSLKSNVSLFFHKLFLKPIIERDILFSSIAMINTFNVNDKKNKEQLKDALIAYSSQNVPGDIPNQVYSQAMSALAFVYYKENQMDELKAIVRKMEKNPINSIYDFLIEKDFLNSLLEGQKGEIVIEYLKNRAGEKASISEFDALIKQVQADKRILE